MPLKVIFTSEGGMRIKKLLSDRRLAAWLLRLGLSIVFLYAAIASFVNPNDWVGYLPQMLRDHVDANLLLKVFSVYELGLAVWLLSGVYLRWAALLCALTFAGIVVGNFKLFDITFRDIALLFAALALATLDES